MAVRPKPEGWALTALGLGRDCEAVRLQRRGGGPCLGLAADKPPEYAMSATPHWEGRPRRIGIEAGRPGRRCAENHSTPRPGTMAKAPIRDTYRPAPRPPLVRLAHEGMDGHAPRRGLVLVLSSDHPAPPALPWPLVLPGTSSQPAAADRTPTPTLQQPHFRGETSCSDQGGRGVRFLCLQLHPFLSTLFSVG